MALLQGSSSRDSFFGAVAVSSTVLISLVQADSYSNSNPSSLAVQYPLQVEKAVESYTI